MLNAATIIDKLQTSADAEIKMTAPRRTRLHHSLTKMICLRRRNGKSDKHLGIKPVSSTRPRKRTTYGLIPAWVHVDVLAKPLDNTISSSHKIERSRHHTSPIKPTGFVEARSRENKCCRSATPTGFVEARSRENKCCRSATPTGFVEARSRENKCCRSATPTGFVEARSEKTSVAEAQPQPVSSKHDFEKTSVAEAQPQPVSSSYTKSSGLVITRAREDTDLVIIYEIERSRHHTSPRRHRSRHHIRNRAVSSSHEPEKTPISSSYTKSSGLVIPIRHRSRHHIRNRAVSSSHEPEKTPISSSYTRSSGLVITRAR
ncbi:unnamed protein product [Microthlaspi erraticum]|uniref:Uncharacterized protein n=1 Tax=Microthlaspi erraticum TaxID=1685480 RepID=A0A6D2L545_9BRAS|nr:unnamed protein product [Microthlaspi erraticum]